MTYSAFHRSQSPDIRYCTLVWQLYLESCILRRKIRISTVDDAIMCLTLHKDFFECKILNLIHGADQQHECFERVQLTIIWRKWRCIG